MKFDNTNNDVKYEEVGQDEDIVSTDDPVFFESKIASCNKSGSILNQKGRAPNKNARLRPFFLHFNTGLVPLYSILGSQKS